jgi:hypothetical protein
MVNGSLVRLANLEQKQAWETQGERLPPGKYLIRVCVDRDDELSQDPSRLLDYRAPEAEAEILAAWKIGFQNAEIVEGSLFQ